MLLEEKTDKLAVEQRHKPGSLTEKKDNCCFYARANNVEIWLLEQFEPLDKQSFQ